MADTRVARKTAPAAKKAVKKAPAKKAAVAKKAPVPKKVAVRKAVPVKKAVKKAAPVKKITTRPAASSRGAAMLAEAVADAAPAPAPNDLLPYAPPAAPPTPRFSKRFVIVAAVAAVAVVASAAGVFAATRDHGPSKIKFIATADALCRPANGPVTAIVKPTSYPELATAAGTVSSTTAAQMTQLKALKRPHGADGKAFEPTFTALSATNIAAVALHDAATKKDDAGAIAATKDMTTKFANAASQAKTYGLTACSVGMQAGFDNVAAGSHDVLKTAFTAKADSLCRASGRASDAIAEPATNLPDLARYLNQNLDVYGKLLTDLKALPVAPGDEAAVTEMLAAAEKANAKLAELRDAVLAKDTARFAATDKEISPLGTAADAKFDAYGLTVCGSNFGDT